MSQAETKIKIIRAAEELFAVNGFHHTSLRSITAKAGVNLAAVNYHFGSKEALLEAVFDQHLLPLNEIRAGRMRGVAGQAAKNRRKPQLEEVLRSFIEPTLALMLRDAETGHFRMLVGRSLTDPDETVRRLFLDKVNAVLQQLFQLLCLALPQSSPASVAWKTHFAMGAMGHILCLQGPAAFFGAVEEDKSVDEIMEMLINFIVRGMEA
ncbi:MAG: hypothetical protein C0613_01410 [Desulfobulbaceae bacterium]|nr:MAG: hypothetical protein C0613_01410 [Desulfobulbaceae bacterium]